jgi:hypothetical protein
MHGDLFSAASWRENGTATTNQGSSLPKVCTFTGVNGALASLFDSFHYIKTTVCYGHHQRLGLANSESWVG